MALTLEQIQRNYLRVKMVQLLKWMEYNNGGDTNEEIVDNFLEQTQKL